MTLTIRILQIIHPPATHPFHLFAMKIKATNILSDLVQRYVFLVPMLNRFGIRLGLGSLTVQEVCEQHKIDPDFFLLIANSCVQPSYVGSLRLTAEHTALMVDYLESANRYFLSSQLRNVQVHLQHFVAKSSQGNSMVQNIPLVLSELENTLSERVRYDEEVLFPEFRTLAESLGKDINQLTLQSIYTEAKNEGSGDRAEALVDDVIQVLIRHIQGDYNENLLYGVLFSLSSLRSDLMINSHLRTCIFMPMLATLRQARQQGIH